MNKLLFFCLFSFSVFAQQTDAISTNNNLLSCITVTNDDLNESFIAAQPKEGYDEFYKRFQNNLEAYNFFGTPITYKFLLSFYVDCDGSFSEIQVLNDLDYGLSGQIIRVMKAMPKWEPAQLNEVAVRSSYTLPIEFN
ncbi:energy transducer TonB [Flavobacterium agricola]|uniref:Energy transducer TonB n=1 Tax=Flavobacterium agricola TaxID=2870839 RepID=A0ABY6M0C1_9FLAO|nr:energy transducer TonB [Flavobacterium agricola]UYW00628.1 energy transducer TonB [Flavobacterium agricola]